MSKSIIPFPIPFVSFPSKLIQKLIGKQISFFLFFFPILLYMIFIPRCFRSGNNKKWWKEYKEDCSFPFQFPFVFPLSLHLQQTKKEYKTYWKNDEQISHLFFNFPFVNLIPTNILKLKTIQKQDWKTMRKQYFFSNSFLYPFLVNKYKEY